MSPETWMAVLGVALAVAAIVLTLRRPDRLQNEYDKKLTALRTRYDDLLRRQWDDYESALRDIRKDLDTMQEELRKTRNDLRETRKLLFAEEAKNQRLNEIMAWMRTQIRLQGMELPLLPPELRDPIVTREGNIVVQIGRDVNAIDVSGTAGQTSAGKGNTQDETQ